MTRARFGVDVELGRPLTKKRARAIATRERIATPSPSPAELRAAEELRATSRWRPVIERIVIGEKYKRVPYIHLPGMGCECEGVILFPEPDRIERQCWQARTSSSIIVRVHDLAFVDERIGPGYSVTMVKPDVWQFRAWCKGGDRLDEEAHPERWHEIGAIIVGPHLGERVP